MYTLDRIKVRKALAEYKESVAQTEAVLNDAEIQGYFSQAFELSDGYTIESKEAEALDKKGSDLITERYPLARGKNQKSLLLISAMIENVEEWKDIEPHRVHWNITVFEKMVALAEMI